MNATMQHGHLPFQMPIREQRVPADGTAIHHAGPQQKRQNFNRCRIPASHPGIHTSITIYHSLQINIFITGRLQDFSVLNSDNKIYDCYPGHTDFTCIGFVFRTVPSQDLCLGSSDRVPAFQNVCSTYESIKAIVTLSGKCNIDITLTI